jgi:D-3-phosphoglycerate dehydrogenase / 2-oxoglutarate reductase
MKVLFLDSVHEVLEQRLVRLGCECIHDYKTSKNEIDCTGIHGIVIRSRFTLDREFLTKCKDLKFIARSGSGLENIDLLACAELGIKVFNSPEGNRTAVGEHAIGMLLMLANNLKNADAEVRNYQWRREENRGWEIEGKTIGVIGHGMMGSAFSQRLKGFGCKILAYDKYKSFTNLEGVEQVEMHRIFDDADIVSLHVPLNEETKYLVKDTWFNSFKKPIVLINTSRGLVVSLSALLGALNSGKVLGACLDVLEYEETSFEKIHLNQDVFNALKERKDVLFSPHVAGWTKESYIKLSSYLADKIESEFFT